MTPKAVPLTEIAEELKANQFIYDEYFDANFARSLAREVVDLLEKVYFRAQVVGLDAFPKRNNPDRPLIYISNHSGMAFPWDGMIMAGMALKFNNYDPYDAFRPLSAPMLSQSVLMNPFLLEEMWKRVGCIDATFKNFETMMYFQESNLLIYPEGVPGIGKGYDKRYQLQRFSSSFIYMSIKYRTDVIPMVTVNGEHINPIAYSIDWINRAINKIGIPFLPISVFTPFILIQPWLFYYAFPAKLTYVLGDRIKPYEMTNKSIDELSRDELQDIAEKVRVKVQAMLDDAVEKHGKKAYKVREWLRSLWDNLAYFPYTVPPGWPLLFTEFERQYKKHGKDTKLELGFLSTLRIIFRNPIVIAYFIPILGWIPILIKGYSKAEFGKKAKKK